MCESARWQDIFLTKPDDDYEFDDEFVAPVMSVAVQKVKVGATTEVTVAKPMKGGSNWLMLAFPGDKDTEDIKNIKALKKGDMIRVGSAGVGGFTDYLTIMETVDADRLINQENTEFEIRSYQYDATVPTQTLAPAANATHLGTTGTTNNTIHATGGYTLRCVRVNYAIDATALDPDMTTDRTFDKDHNNTTVVSDETRGEVSIYKSHPTRSSLFYPCYKQRRWTSAAQPTRSVMKLTMPSHIKKVHGLKLVGYTMVHKSSVGVQQQHEMKEDDWFAIRFKEFAPLVTLSNNSHANGAFYVVHGGTGTQRTAGSVELHEYDREGLACSTFSPINLPSLTMDIVDRNGQQANFGRMHLWLRVLVSGA